MRRCPLCRCAAGRGAGGGGGPARAGPPAGLSLGPQRPLRVRGASTPRTHTGKPFVCGGKRRSAPLRRKGGVWGTGCGGGGLSRTQRMFEQVNNPVPSLMRRPLVCPCVVGAEPDGAYRGEQAAGTVSDLAKYHDLLLIYQQRWVLALALESFPSVNAVLVFYITHVLLYIRFSDELEPLVICLCIKQELECRGRGAGSEWLSPEPPPDVYQGIVVA